MHKLALSLAAFAFATAARAEAPASPYTFTAHIDVVSQYILRGITTTYGNGEPLGNKGADAAESNKPVLQWGADLVHSSGFSVGYWASQINYSYERLGESYSDRGITDFQSDKSIENDLYASYSGSVGELGYNLGFIGYYYYNGEASNAFESKFGLSYGPVSLNAQTLLSDTVWGNRGDTYWTLNYSRPLPHDVTFNGSLGFYTYKKEGKYLGTRDTRNGVDCAAGESFVVNGCFAGATPESSAFRHLVLGFTGPIGDTGFTWGAQLIIAGENRFGIDQDEDAVFTVSYLF